MSEFREGMIDEIFADRIHGRIVEDNTGEVFGFEIYRFVTVSYDDNGHPKFGPKRVRDMDTKLEVGLTVVFSVNTASFFVHRFVSKQKWDEAKAKSASQGGG